ncbi:MAG: peptidoglycan bridge formation glycyltransferase FemA/FemB family protein [Bacteroidales bacterium]|nr:peptidoglycan bridge formation glycyltransferase FemA/FemB family protein [Bacteroidales bacterium]MCF8402563.1 peptidoglycan bridge formation glycyltransferase FemA/FemB family protein [Bacteroidales bacterium]
MNYKVISKYQNIKLTEWDNFVGLNPNGTVFQSSEMMELFNKTHNYQPVPICVLIDNKIVGVILGVIIKEYSGPLGFFSSRTVVYGGPLTDPFIKDTERVIDLLINELISKVKNRSIFIQFRNFSDQSNFIPIFNKYGFNFMERLNYLVDTTSEKLVKKRMSNSKLRQVRKGLETGVEIRTPENEKEVKSLYQILSTLYKKKVKKPLPNYSFFKNFYEQSKKGKLGEILLVLFEKKVIGGIVSPVFRDKTIYEWYVCGLDQEYKHLYPSVLATWAAMDYALKNNIQAFDFMGVGVPDKDYGVREFKSKFGGELVNYGRFGRINNKFLYAITEVGFNVLALMKKI